MRQRLLLSFLLLLTLAACDTRESDPLPAAASPVVGGTSIAASPEASPDGANYDPSRDYFTEANYRQFRLQHLVLDLDVDFDQQRLQGQALLRFARLDPLADELILDSRGLQIEAVSLLSEEAAPEELSFLVTETRLVLGEAIQIHLPETARSLADFELQITYHTGPNPSAIMWLSAGMTAGGEHPFMFTQSQAIHARSWVPLQDTPAVRFTYEARIHTPPQLRAVMSANNDPGAGRGNEHHFVMPQLGSRATASWSRS